MEGRCLLRRTWGFKGLKGVEKEKLKSACTIWTGIGLEHN